MSKIPTSATDWVAALRELVGEVRFLGEDDSAPLGCEVKPERAIVSGHLSGISPGSEMPDGTVPVRVTIELRVPSDELDAATNKPRLASEMTERERERVEDGIKRIRHEMRDRAAERGIWECVHDEWDRYGRIPGFAYRAAMAAVDRMDNKFDSYTSNREREQLKPMLPPEGAFMSVDGVDLRDELE